MATKRVTINKSNGANDVVDFAIPESAGIYKLSFVRGDGTVLNAGNIEVDGTIRTYLLTFGLSNGNNISAGTFTTPSAPGWHSVFSGSQTIVSGSGGATQTMAGIKAGVPTKIWFSGYLADNNSLSPLDYKISSREGAGNGQSPNGVFNGSGNISKFDQWEEFQYVASFGFSLTMQNDAVYFLPYIHGEIYDFCDEYCGSFGLGSATLTITKIEQYY